MNQTGAKPMGPYSATDWIVNLTETIWGRIRFMKINTDIIWRRIQTLQSFEVKHGRSLGGSVC